MAETTIHLARTDLKHIGDGSRQLSQCGMWLTHNHFSVNIDDITCRSYCREVAIRHQKQEQRRQEQAANRH